MIDPKLLPKQPGVYLFKDQDEKILYIGKAKSLRDRVKQYFGPGPHAPKTLILRRHIASVDFIVVGNEVEALLLENKLIKQHKPKYNIMLKDSKTYAYIKITDETFPRILSTRRVTSKGTYFGPYTDGSARNELVQLAVQLFMLRTCKTLPKRACLNYHIGLCTAPCIRNVDEQTYRHQVEAAIEFLKGDTKPILRRLRAEMTLAANNQRYEIALEKRNQIEAIEVLKSGQHVDTQTRHDQDIVALNVGGQIAIFACMRVHKGVLRDKREFRIQLEDEVFEHFLTTYYDHNPIPREVIVSEEFWRDDAQREALQEYLGKRRGGPVILTHPLRGHKRALVDIAKKNAVVEDAALAQLQDALNLPQLPMVIECFDISNLRDEHIVAGMTRWVGGRPDTDGYRRFLVRNEGQDDFAAMHEAVSRRYKRLHEEGGPLPNLILIDGGKGQLASAFTALNELGLQIPIVAIAKQEEELFLPGEEESRRFDVRSRMMLLVRGIRDSVHRYALAYHRKRREMGTRESLGK